MAISNVAPLLLDPRHDIILGQYDGYRQTPGVVPESRTPTYILANLVIDDTRWLGVKVTLETGKALDRKESSIRLVFKDGTEKIFIETSNNKNNAYEVLLQKGIERDASYFVRWDSVRAAWQVVDELLHCTDNCPILQMYKPGEVPHIKSA
jgi:glucose-6-phosphate 1-dehydrogenase